MNKPESKTKFHTAMLVFISCLLFIILITWIIATMFFSSYEKSQPIYAVNEYINNIDYQTAEKLCAPLLSQLSDLQDGSIIINNMANSIHDSVAVKDSRNSNNSKYTYYLHDGNSYIEKLTLTPGQNLGFGFKKWEVLESSLLLKTLGENISVSVPSGYEVYINDSLLDETYILDDKVEYELLKGFYEDSPQQLPYLTTYITGELVGDVNLYAKTSEGTTLNSDQLNEDYYCNNCSESDKQLLEDFIYQYVPAYISFLSNSNRDTEGNYYRVIQFVKSGSKLEERLRDAKKSNGFNTSHGDELEQIRIPHMMNCGSGIFVCNVQFDYITTGMDSRKTEMTTQFKLMVQKSSNGVIQAVQMVQY